MSQRYLLGIDIGSSGCKITLIDTGGNLLYAAAHEYPTYYPQPGWAEQDPEDWYASVCRATTALVSAGFAPTRVAAIALSAPTHTAVLLDRHYRVLRHAILWTDQRSARIVERLDREAGQAIMNITYNQVSTVWTLPHLMWVKEHEPEVWRHTAHVLFAKDYVRWRLTGNCVTDAIDALGSLLFDARTQRWSDELCCLAELCPEILPPVVAPTALGGKITERAALATGLAAGTPVIVGATDTVLEVLGAGAVQPGQATVKLATAGRICGITLRAYPHPHVFNYPHVVTGLWYPGTGTKSCASSYRWLRQLLFADVHEGAYARMDALASEVEPGAEGLVFHPYLLGELSPYGDPFLRAGFTGVTMRHTRAHFARAVLEGVALSLRDSMSVLDELEIPIRDIRIIGGGAKSPLWRQIVCDVLGCTAAKPVHDDSSFGGAMLAGIGIGAFAGPEEAVAACVTLSDVTLPNPNNQARYAAVFDIYKEVHDKLAPIYRKHAPS